ncbi:MAG: CPBP family intramembrane metalloprotease [Planctomycetota bacterium]|nr:MAG: CPBP family intramembrane metalloprotease [Planctomycetota bacterium]
MTVLEACILPPPPLLWTFCLDGMISQKVIPFSKFTRLAREHRLLCWQIATFGLLTIFWPIWLSYQNSQWIFHLWMDHEFLTLLLAMQYALLLTVFLSKILHLPLLCWQSPRSAIKGKAGLRATAGGVFLTLAVVALSETALQVQPKELWWRWHGLLLASHWLPLIIATVASRFEQAPVLESTKEGMLGKRSMMTICTGFACIALFLIFLQFLDKAPKSQDWLHGIGRLRNFPALVLIAVSAAFSEEVLFRGYLFGRLKSIFRTPLMAALVSSLIFGLVHQEYGQLHMAFAFILGLIYTAMAAFSRSLIPSILVHCFLNLLQAAIESFNLATEL